MTLSRRQTLSILGGGVIVAAAGFGHAITRQPQTAGQPWGQAGRYEEPRMRALSHAILAPNPHNRQPWLVDLRRDGEVTLRVDHTRLLPHTDPFSRQIVVGLGCFLELMVLAAAQDGFRVDLTLFPDGEDPQALTEGRIAVARFVPGQGVAEPALFDQIPHRRSNKEPYDTTRPVESAALAALSDSAVRGTTIGVTNTAEDVDALRRLTVEAFQIELTTPRTYEESVDLFRIGHAEVDANPDGLDFTGPMFEAMRITRMFSQNGARPIDSFAARSGLQMALDTAQTGMAYVWLVTPGNTRAEQIMAGRDWVRLNLRVTGLGLDMQPMSQALQEYPEMASLYAQAHALMAPQTGVVQMLGRLGYGIAVGQSPRWPLETRIVNA